MATASWRHTAVLLILLCALDKALGDVEDATATNSVEGTLSVLVGENAYYHHVFADDGALYILSLTGAPAMPSGTRVRVNGTITATVDEINRTFKLAVDSLEALKKQEAAVGTSATNIKALFVLMSMCNDSNTLSIPAANSVFFGTGIDNGSISLQQWYASCSSGITTLASDSKVVAVSLGCNGTTSKGKAWRADVCDSNAGTEYIFTDAANDVIKQQMSAEEFTSYQFKVYVFNNNNPCPDNGNNYIGLGRFGCNYESACIAWIAGGWNDKVQVYAHELGHNMMLGHAGYYGKDYGDWSCAMGNAEHYRCFNAPHQWQLGWSAERYPLLSGSNLPPGNTRAYFLPAMDTDPNNMLRIVVDWVGDSIPNVYWLSFRRTGGYQGVDQLVDQKLFRNWGNMLAIHTYNVAGSAAANYATYQQLTYLVTLTNAPRNAGDVWSYKSLFVRLIDISTTAPGYANITVCRQDGTSETPAQCFDGLDNDCDGLVDTSDPDCSAFSPNPPAPFQVASPNPSPSPSPSPLPSPIPSPVPSPLPSPVPSPLPPSPLPPSPLPSSPLNSPPPSLPNSPVLPPPSPIQQNTPIPPGTPSPTTAPPPTSNAPRAVPRPVKVPLCRKTYIYALTLTSTTSNPKSWPVAKTQLVAALKTVYKQRKLPYPGPTRLLDVNSKGVPLQLGNRWRFRLQVNLGACATVARARSFLKALQAALKPRRVTIASDPLTG